MTQRYRSFVLVFLSVFVASVGCRRDDVQMAIHRLETGSPEQRIVAAQKLTTLRAERAKETLLKSLKSEDAALRRVVAEGFAKWGDAELGRAAVQTLSNDLENADANIQRAAVQTLITIETPEATSALIAALQNANAVVREIAAKNLVARHATLSGDDALRLDLVLGNVENVAARGKDALSTLTTLLDADPARRASAANAIALIGEPTTVKRAVELMLTDIKDDDAATRARAVNALGALGDKSAIAPLENLAANDSDANVRASAKVAGYVLQKDIVSLISTFSDPNPQLQSIAVRGVRNVPLQVKAAAVEPLIRLLRATTDVRLAAEATMALGTCGSYATKPLLDALGSEPEWELRKRLAAALDQPRVRTGMTKSMEVVLYNLYEKEVNDAVKNDLGRLLKALES
jgi:HEAT repeat protein